MPSDPPRFGGAAESEGVCESENISDANVFRSSEFGGGLVLVGGVHAETAALVLREHPVAGYAPVREPRGQFAVSRLYQSPAG